MKTYNLFELRRSMIIFADLIDSAIERQDYNAITAYAKESARIEKVLKDHDSNMANMAKQIQDYILNK